jgi:hypothetical protein
MKPKHLTDVWTQDVIEPLKRKQPRPFHTLDAVNDEWFRVTQPIECNGRKYLSESLRSRATRDEILHAESDGKVIYRGLVFLGVDGETPAAYAPAEMEIRELTNGRTIGRVLHAEANQSRVDVSATTTGAENARNKYLPHSNPSAGSGYQGATIEMMQAEIDKHRAKKFTAAPIRDAEETRAALPPGTNLAVAKMEAGIASYRPAKQSLDAASRR